VHSFVLSLLLFSRFKIACLMFENTFLKTDSRFHLRMSTCSKIYSVLTGSYCNFIVVHRIFSVDFLLLLYLIQRI